MARTIRELLVSVGIDADEEGLNRLDRGLANIKSGLGRIAEASAVAATSLGAVGGALFAQAKASGEYSKQILTAAESTNTTTREYQRLTFAAQRYGAEQDDVNDVLGVLSDRAEDARRGTASFQEAFEMLGIKSQELRDLRPDEILKLIAQRTREMREQGEVQQVLPALERLLGGDLRRKIMPLLEQGREGIELMGDEAEQLAVVLEKQSLRRGLEFAIQWRRVSHIMEGLRHQLGVALAPALTRILQDFEEWIRANREAINQRIDEFARQAAEGFREFADAVETADKWAQSFGGWAEVLQWAATAAASFVGLWAASGVVSVLTGVGQIVLWLGGAFASIPGIVASVGGALSSLWSTITIVGGAFSQGLVPGIAAAKAALAPFLVAAAKAIAIAAAVAAAIAAVVLVAEDLYVWFQGGKSVTGQLIQAFGDLATRSNFLFDYLRSIGEVLSAVAEVALGVLEPAFRVVSSVGLAVFEGIKQVVLTLWTVASGVFRAMAALFVPVFRLQLTVARVAFHAIAGVIRWLWGNVFQPFVQDVARWFVWLYGGLRSGFQTVGSAIRSALSGVFDWVVSQLEMIGGWINALSDALGSLVDQDVGEAAEQVDEATDGTGDGDEGGDTPGGGGGPRRSRRRTPQSRPRSGAEQRRRDRRRRRAPAGPVRQGGRRRETPERTEISVFSGGSRREEGGEGGGEPQSGGGDQRESEGMLFGGVESGDRSGRGMGEGPAPSDLAAGGERPEDLAGARGEGRETVNVQYEGGDTEMTIEQREGETDEQFLQRVREIVREEREKEAKQVKDAVVRGAEE